MRLFEAPLAKKNVRLEAPRELTGIPRRLIGDADCLRAAVANGADAVYFGLREGFHARARAPGIAADDLADVMTISPTEADAHLTRARAQLGALLGEEHHSVS